MTINEKEFFNSMLRKDFKSFVIKVFKEISPAPQYLDNWHIDLICSELIDMMEGKQNRLIINIPPRHMKSIICSVALPAFVLGHNPKTSIIVVSYGDDLATIFAYDCKRVMESPWYKEIFPGTKLAKDKKSTNDFKTTKGGNRYATSVNGTLTGRGAEWIIIDDPIKPTEANSDLQREKANAWYGNTLYSRLDDKRNGKIILVMQRLHEDDMTGYLLATDPHYKLIKLQAIAEQDEKWTIKIPLSSKEKIIERKKGEALHSTRDDIDLLMQTKASMSSYDFAGQYQQNPAPIDGGIIKKKWFIFYNEEELLKALENNSIQIKSIIQSWDTANKVEEHNDYSACVTFLRDTKGKCYVLNVFREKLEFPSLIKKIVQMHNLAKEKYKHSIKVLVEDKASGTQILQSLKKDHNIHPIPIKPEHDKKARLMGISHFIENGVCLFPGHKPHWWVDFENELLKFPQGKYDDQCDAFSQGLNYPDKATLFDAL